MGNRVYEYNDNLRKSDDGTSVQGYSRFSFYGSAGQKEVDKRERGERKAQFKRNRRDSAMKAEYKAKFKPHTKQEKEKNTEFWKMFQRYLDRGFSFDEAMEKTKKRGLKRK